MKICNLQDIKDGGACQYSTSDQIDVFIVRAGQSVYGYYNSCPHTGAPLNWLPDQFLDGTGNYIQCRNHDALFRISDGVCVHGPCIGQSLRPINLSVNDDLVSYNPHSFS